MKITTRCILALLLPVTLTGAATDVNNEIVERAVEAVAVNDTSKVIDLDELVVVAQPKEQVRLRLQPVSSNVFGSEQLQQLNVHDLSQLSQYVPSFAMPSYGARLTSSMYVRGIGSRINSPATTTIFPSCRRLLLIITSICWIVWTCYAVRRVRCTARTRRAVWFASIRRIL